MAMQEWQELLYAQRLNRFQQLVALNAPKFIIANEALLIASAVFNVTNLIQHVTDLAADESNHFSVEATTMLTKMVQHKKLLKLCCMNANQHYQDSICDIADEVTIKCEVCGQTLHYKDAAWTAAKQG